MFRFLCKHLSLHLSLFHLLRLIHNIKKLILIPISSKENSCRGIFFPTLVKESLKLLSAEKTLLNGIGPLL